MRWILIFMTAFILLNQTYGLTCNEIMALPLKKMLTFKELQTVQPKDIVQCVGHLGRNKLKEIEADFIWQSIKIYYKGVANIPNRKLMDLNWVTPAIMPEEYVNITLHDVEVIHNFGLPYNLHKEQLYAIANQIRQGFAGKRMQDYTDYDLLTLGDILCGFSREEIEMIQPSAYKEAAYSIGQLKLCSGNVLAGFATLAMQPDAFGSPKYWDDDVKETVGYISNYIPKNING